MSFRLTIITVVKNARADLSRTLESLKNNQFELKRANSELLVVDGLSTDGSWSLAMSAQRIIGLPTQCFQQRPHGIYAAMNFGSHKSRGEWILYINAGDILYDCRNLKEKLEGSSSSAILFRSGIKRPHGNFAYAKIHSWDICHQAFVYRKILHQNLGDYCCKLLVCADTLFLSTINQDHIQYDAQLLSITDVSPSNASRNPRLVRKDLRYLSSTNIQLKPWKHPLLTQIIMTIEYYTGISWSVFAKVLYGVAISQYERIRL